MGAGKTSLGLELSRYLSAPFVDIDEEIVHRENSSITTIFSNHGEKYFRDIESNVLAIVSCGKPSVVSTGGGIVGSEINWQYMHRYGIIVYLRASWMTLKKRIGSGSGRPLANNNGWDSTYQLFEKRRELYEKADFIVDTDNLTLEDTVKKVLSQVIDVLYKK